MKRILATVLTFMLLLCLTPAVFADNTVYTEGYFYYTVDDGSVTIVGYFGTESEVTVPAFIAGVPVNTIAPGAFDGTGVTKVNLPDTIMSYDAGGTNLDVVLDSNTDHPYDPQAETESPSVSEETQVLDDAYVDLDLTEEQTEDPNASQANDPEKSGEETGKDTGEEPEKGQKADPDSDPDSHPENMPEEKPEDKPEQAKASAAWVAVGLVALVAAAAVLVVLAKRKAK